MDNVKNTKPLWPDIIYHYASPDALLGIIESESIWATHYAFLNDRHEMLTGYNYVKSLWEDIKTKNNKVSKGNFEKWDSLIFDYENKLKNYGKNIFIACFSENQDSLSQWRLYCPQTGGFAIGFKYSPDDKRREFENKLKKEYDYSNLFFQDTRCYYDTSSINSPVDVRLKPEVIKDLLGIAFNADKNGHPDAESYFLEQFLTAMLSIKNHTFKEEQELRFIFEINDLHAKINGFKGQDNLLLNFNGIKPYIPIPMNRLSIEEIVISPQADQTQFKLFLENLKSKYDLKFKIISSSSSYRNI
jgi:DUF2971 family protein